MLPSERSRILRSLHESPSPLHGLRWQSGSGDTALGGNCAAALATGLVVITPTDHIRRWVTRRQRKCITSQNRTVQNQQVGLEMRLPMVVERITPRQWEGESGAPAPFLLSKYLGKQSNNSQPNGLSDPKSCSLFSALSGLKMGTRLLTERPKCRRQRQPEFNDFRESQP